VYQVLIFGVLGYEEVENESKTIGETDL